MAQNSPMEMTLQRLSVLSCNHFPETAWHLLTISLTAAHRLLQLTEAYLTLPEDKLQWDSDTSAATHQVFLCETLSDTSPYWQSNATSPPTQFRKLFLPFISTGTTWQYPDKPMPSAKQRAPWATSGGRLLRMMLKKTVHQRETVASLVTSLLWEIL